MIIVRRKSVWTRQPHGPVNLDPAYANAPTTWIPANQRALSYNGAFLVTKTEGGSNPGRYVGCDAVSYSTAMANAAAASVNTRNFSLLAVLRLHASGGAGVGIRDKGSNILLRRNSGNWSVRIAGGDYSGSAVPLGVWLTYILNSSSEGVSLTVNGSTVLSGAAASSGSMGSVLDLWSDSQGGGSVNMDLALLHLQRRPLTPAEIRARSINPWAIHRARTRRTIISLGAAQSGTLDASATGAAQSGGAASLAAQVALAGVGVSVAGGSAFAGVSVPLSAAGIAIAGGSAGATATVRISAAGLAQAAGSAGLSASILLAAAGAAQAAGNGQLAAQLAALASGAAQAGGSATLSGGAPGALAASGGGQAGGQAVLSVTVQLAATGAAQAGGSATGSASAPGQIAASGSAQSGGSATVSVTVQITAAGFVQAMGAGELTVHIPISASGAAISAGLANLTAGGVVRSVAPCRQIQVAAERRTIAVPAERRRVAVPAENRRVRVL